jgi:hypothetical protein
VQTKTLLIVATAVASLASAGCGRTDLGRSPSQIVVDRMEAASGAKPTEFGGTLFSDVVTNVRKQVNGQQVDVPTIFADLGRVTLRAVLRDNGPVGSPAQPTPMNAVTFSRYHVSYVRADGRNTQGVDVPYAFDSAFTATVPAGGSTTAAFELVRHDPKMEAPLAALASNPTIIGTIAEITFYGQDLAGNDVVARATIGVEFGNFGDPQ